MGRAIKCCLLTWSCSWTLVLLHNSVPIQVCIRNAIYLGNLFSLKSLESGNHFIKQAFRIWNVRQADTNLCQAVTMPTYVLHCWCTPGEHPPLPLNQGVPMFVPHQLNPLSREKDIPLFRLLDTIGNKRVHKFNAYHFNRGCSWQPEICPRFVRPWTYNEWTFNASPPLK